MISEAVEELLVVEPEVAVVVAGEPDDDIHLLGQGEVLAEVTPARRMAVGDHRAAPNPVSRLIGPTLRTVAPVDDRPRRIPLLLHLQCRSEEHTSELQSRFGISYAVF